MKVSVCITTYNHKPFIAEAIDSALMQETGFDYEILVGEDDSSDGTREIVKAYGEAHPDKIRLFLNDRKNVITIDGRPTGRWNFLNNLRHATGEYIALLEGDDFWTDSLKLQRQVEYLDSHPQCSMCFHNAINLLPDGSRQDYVRRFDVRIKPRYSLTDILTRNFIPTCSVFMRNGLITDLPREAYETPAFDILLYVLLAEQGCLGYIDEQWAVRRVHPGGTWSSRSETERHLGDIKWLQAINSYLAFRYKAVIERDIVRHCHALVYQSGSTSMDPGAVEETVSGARERLTDLSRQLSLSDAVRRRVMGRVYLDLAFAVHSSPDPHKAFSCIGHAVRYDPKNLGHPRVLYIVAERLLGRRAAVWLKRRASAAFHSSPQMLVRRRGS